MLHLVCPLPIHRSFASFVPFFVLLLLLTMMLLLLSPFFLPFICCID